MCCTTPFAGIRITDLHGGAGQRDDLAGFGIPLFKADEGGKGGVVQDEVIGFAMLGNEHREIRDGIFVPRRQRFDAPHTGRMGGTSIGQNHRNLSAGYPVQTLWRSRNCRHWPGRPENSAPASGCSICNLIAGNGQRHSFCFRIGCIRLVISAAGSELSAGSCTSVVFRGGAAFPGPGSR